MEDLLSKEHCCYKTHTLITKSCAYPPPLIQITQSFFRRKSPPLPSPTSMIFQKSQPLINKGGSHRGHD